MLFEFLDNVRQKPKSVRNQYAFGFAVCSTLIIGGVWSLSLPSRFATLGNTAAVSDASSTVPTTPFAGLFEQLKQQFAGAKEVIQKIPSGTTTAAIDSTRVSSSTQNETEAALNLQINSENKINLQASSSESTYQPTNQPTILIATTSATTTR